MFKCHLLFFPLIFKMEIIDGTDDSRKSSDRNNKNNYQ